MPGCNVARTVERTFSVQLASGGTAQLLSHLAGARQMSAGVKLARCHSGREGQNLFQKCAKSMQDKVAREYIRKILHAC